MGDFELHYIFLFSLRPLPCVFFSELGMCMIRTVKIEKKCVFSLVRVTNEPRNGNTQPILGINNEVFGIIQSISRESASAHYYYCKVLINGLTREAKLGLSQ